MGRQSLRSKLAAINSRRDLILLGRFELYVLKSMNKGASAGIIVGTDGVEVDHVVSKVAVAVLYTSHEQLSKKIAELNIEIIAYQSYVAAIRENTELGKEETTRAAHLSAQWWGCSGVSARFTRHTVIPLATKSIPTATGN